MKKISVILVMLSFVAFSFAQSNEIKNDNSSAQLELKSNAKTSVNVESSTVSTKNNLTPKTINSATIENKEPMKVKAKKVNFGPTTEIKEIDIKEEKEATSEEVKD